MPFYLAADRDVHPAPVPVMVACRCCPGGVSRSTRGPPLPLGHERGGMGGLRARHCPARRGWPGVAAGERVTGMRDIVDAIRYLTHNGPAWRALPAGSRPQGRSTGGPGKWQADGSTERTHDDLRERVRLAAGRKPRPTAAIIDSQSVKGSEMIARTRRGDDAGKKINGTKRHLAVDALGLLLTVLVTAASVQDRDAARPCCCGTCGGPSPLSSWPGLTGATRGSWSPGPRPGCA